MKRVSLSTILPLIQTYEIFIACVVLMAGLLAATVIFLYPNVKKVQEILSQKQQLDQRYAVLKRKDSQLSGMNERTYVDFLQRMELIIPQSKDFVSLFYTFDALEQKTHVTISQTEFQFGVVSTDSAQLIKSSLAGAYVVPFRAIVNAPLGQISLFLDSLSDLSGRYLTVEDVQWAFASDTSVKMNLSGQAYFLPVSGKIGSLDTPVPALTIDQQDLFDQILAMALPQADSASQDQVDIGKPNLFE